MYESTVLHVASAGYCDFNIFEITHILRIFLFFNQWVCVIHHIVTPMRE